LHEREASRLPFFDSLRKLFGGRKPAMRLPRRWPRLLMSEPVTLLYDRGERRSMMLQQLSARGARVQSAGPSAPHAQVVLALDLGAGLRSNLEAEVVYSQRDRQALHFNNGLRFLHIGHEGVPEIACYIEEEQARRRGTGQKWQG